MCSSDLKINKILEKFQQLENSCAEVTTRLKKISARFKKISAVIHNYEVTNDKKVRKKILKQGEGYE